MDILEEIEKNETFRDHLATVDEKGDRIWIYPKKPKGRFYDYRTWVSYVFLALFLITPFIKVNGEQILMFNIIERKFILFGLLFTPLDFHIFGAIMLTFLVFIVLFTVVYGRLFCGWVCPQTVFMEMFFRKIEYWIDGDANEQRKLDKRDWDFDKYRKRILKHLIFFLIAVVVANYFLAYIIGMDEVLKIIKEPLNQHVIGFVAMIVFSFVFYGVFSRMREQVCTTICPYGRLQSVLIVPETIVIAYDYQRGEPRGKLKKTAPKTTNIVQNIQNDVQSAALNIPKETAAAEHALKLGDCIDCKLCIQVCPTGIDIRNGTQLECVNCTACIDVCDEVMDKIEKPRGLIRYDSLKGIKEKTRQVWTTRVKAYTAVLALLIVLDIFLLVGRSEVEATILRSPGQMFQEVDNQHISNLYTFQITNKTTEEMPLQLKIKDNMGVIKFVGNKTIPSVAKGKMAEGAFFIEMDKSKLTGMKTNIRIEVYSNDKLLTTVKTNFMGPMQ